MQTLNNLLSIVTCTVMIPKIQKFGDDKVGNGGLKKGW